MNSEMSHALANFAHYHAYNNELVAAIRAGVSFDHVVEMTTAQLDERDRAFYKALARRASDEVRTAIINSPVTPIEILEVLYHTEASLRGLILMRRRLSEELVAEVIAANHASALLALAQNPHTTTSELLSFPHINSPKLKIALALHKNMPESAVIDMIDRHCNRCVMEKIAASKKSGVRVLHTLVLHGDEEIECAVAKNTSAGYFALRQLSLSTHHYVRAAVAKNRSTPTCILQKLLSDSRAEVKKAATAQLEARLKQEKADAVAVTAK